MLLKYCWACKTHTPTGDFAKCARNKDGLQSECRPCANARAREYSKVRKTPEWIARNPQAVEARKGKHREQSRRRRAREPDAEKIRRASDAEYADRLRLKEREAYRKRRLEKPDEIKEARKKWRENNRQEINRKLRDWKRGNSEKVKQANKAYREANRDKRTESGKEYRRNNAEKCRETALRRSRANKSVINSRTAARKALRLKATPRWAKPDKVKSFYGNAEETSVSTGRPHEVDHIVPLKSTKVCGLHWEGNLQVVERRENRQKGNRYWPDMWETATCPQVLTD